VIRGALEQLDFGAQDLALEHLLNIVSDAVEHVFHELFFIADRHQADLGPLPFVLEIKLGQGNVVFLPDPVLDPVQAVPLVLQGPGLGKMDIKEQQSDDHGR
jgi:hypothetical protein